MPDDKSISLVNLGKLSKPANTLIEKVSDAVGGAFKPYQTKRVAKAEAEAALIKAEGEIQVTELQRRTVKRFFDEEAKRQENMERIIEKVIPQLNDESDASNIEDDWVANFFDKSRIVSDEEMQNIWANVLAGEANAPGSYSKRTVNLLSDLDKRDAELFQTLCRFVTHVGTFIPVMFDSRDKIYTDLGISFSSLNHLEAIGLIKFGAVSGFAQIRLPKNFTAIYCNKEISLVFEKDEGNELPVGQVLLTQAGTELARIIRVPCIEGFEDYLKEKWKQHIPEPKEEEDVTEESL